MAVQRQHQFTLNKSIYKKIFRVQDKIKQLLLASDIQTENTVKPFSIEVNYISVQVQNSNEIMNYHLCVAPFPEKTVQYYKIGLEELIRKYYENINMSTTMKLKKIAAVIKLFDEDNTLPNSFLIGTTVIILIQMKKVEEYMKKMLSSFTLGDRFHELNIAQDIFKNQASLRFTNIGRSVFITPLFIKSNVDFKRNFGKEFFKISCKVWNTPLTGNVFDKQNYITQPLLTYITNQLDCNLDSEMDLSSSNALKGIVEGLMVTYTHPKEPFKILEYEVEGLLDSSAKYSFNKSIGQSKGRQNIKVSVVQHFKKTYNYDIKYPNLPCLDVSDYNNRKWAIPIELCSVTMKMDKLNKNQTTLMIENTGQPGKHIQNAVLPNRFGVIIHNDFTRILRKDYTNIKMIPNTKSISHKKVVINYWIILNLDKRVYKNSIKVLENFLMTCKGQNIYLSQTPTINENLKKFILRSTPLNEIKRRFYKFCCDSAYLNELIVVIVPDDDKRLVDIMTEAEKVCGKEITIQFIKTDELRSMSYKLMKPIMFNIKFKFINQSNYKYEILQSDCPTFAKGMIVFGATLVQSYQEQKTTPSVVLLVGMIDSVMYHLSRRLQPSGIKIIEDLENMVFEQLIKYGERVGFLPKKIMYLRNGTNEPTFLQSLEYEFIAIKRACLRIYANFQPAITMVVVNKHQPRKMFMNYKYKCSATNYGFDISQANYYFTNKMFVMCGHYTGDESPRPPRYYVIWDDNEFTQENMEEIVCCLCFKFLECPQCVPYPLPLYISNWEAYRLLDYVQKYNIKELTKHHDENLQLLSSNFPLHFH